MRLMSKLAISFIDILLLIVDDQDKRKSKEEKKLSLLKLQKLRKTK